MANLEPERNLLVDHARAKHSDKRGGVQHQVTLQAVKGDWGMARDWLRGELSKRP